MNQKQELIELSARNVLRHAFGNIKYTHDIGIQYDFIMKEGSPQLKDLISSIFRNRGLLNSEQ